MRKILVGVAIASCLAGAPARADVTSGFFAEPGLGARARGMGGAFAALADDAFAPLYNPAGLAQNERLAFSAEYADLYELGLLSETYFDAQFPAWGFTHDVSYLNVGTKFDPLPGSLDEGTLSYGVARRFGFLSLGGVVKYMNVSSSIPLSTISVEGTGFGLDAGLLYEWTPEWWFGASIRNLASRVTYGTGTDESVPQVWRLGVAYRRGRRLRMALDFVGERGEALKEIRGGAEYWILHPEAARAARSASPVPGGAEEAAGDLADLAFALRGGFRSEMVGTQSTFPSFGLSLGVAGLALDYAFEFDNAAIGETNRFSVTYAFGPPSPTSEPERSEVFPPYVPAPAPVSPWPSAPPSAPAAPAAPAYVPPPPAPPAPMWATTVAVLNFEDRTGDPALGWLAMGLPEIISSECASGRLGVGAVERARLPAATSLASDAARALGATHVVTGMLVRAGPGRVGVAVRIFDAASGRLVDFAETEGAPEDLFDLGRRLAASVAASAGGAR